MATIRPPTLADLQAQQRQVQQELNNLRAPTTTMGRGMEDYQRRQEQLRLRLQGLSHQQQALGSGGSDPMQDDLNKIRQLTEGRAGELANDPYQKSAMDFLQGVTTGKDVPFTNAVQGAILAQQGRGSADAEAAQMASLRESAGANGGSIYDPSYQSAAREALSQRQGRNLDAAGNMAAQAGIANFNARMGGANNLSSARGAQNAQINQMNLAGADYRARDRRVVDSQPTMTTTVSSAAPSQPRASSGPWMGFSGQGSGNYAPVAPATANPQTMPVPGQVPAPVRGPSQNVPAPVASIPAWNPFASLQPSVASLRNTDPRRGPVAEPRSQY